MFDNVQSTLRSQYSGYSVRLRKYVALQYLLVVTPTIRCDSLYQGGACHITR